MDIQLSAQQQAVVGCNEPRIVVKACPGSGKTFSVAARMAKLLRENNLSRHRGLQPYLLPTLHVRLYKKNLKRHSVVEI